MKQAKKITLFARRLRELMEARELTQQKVADAAGVSRIAVVKWLKGAYPGSAELYRLSKAFGLKMQDFFEVVPHDGTAGEKLKTTSALKIPVNAFKLDELERLGKSINFLESECKYKVDIWGGVDSLGSVKRELPTWKQLKRDIIGLTSNHGQKAALAKEMKVSRQVLGNWLSSDKDGGPNAEQTLWLLEWVKSREGQP